MTPTITRTKSAPMIMITPVEFLPIPYVKPSTMRLPRKLKPYPLPILPSRPEPVRWHYRNELQRRVSPIASSFSVSPTSPTSKTLGFRNGERSPASPARPVSGSQYQRPKTDGVEDSVYVLTLGTSREISDAMQELRTKWFPKHKNKVPAHITLFHALPGSKLGEVSDWVEGLSRRMTCFNLSTGTVMRRKNGVAINVGMGEKEIKRVFVSLRSNWFDWLSEQDQSLKAHWTVQNKESDAKRVEEAFEDAQGAPELVGQATGLVLWKYKPDGTWLFEKEYGFQRDGEETKEGAAVQQGAIDGMKS